MSKGATANMADRARSAKSAVYPMVARTSTARRPNAAADRARLQALGPGSGGDGAAARRPLRPLQSPLLRSSEVGQLCWK